MFFNAILDVFRNMRQPLARHLLQPLLTACVLTVLYAGYHIVHQSSIVDGLRVAFVETDADRASRIRDREDATMQAELHHVAMADQAIDKLLADIVGSDPSIARARLDVIHNGVHGMTGLGLLRYDLTNSIAGAGHAPGAMFENQPLSEWSQFLPDLLDGKCGLIGLDGMHGSLARARLEALNVGTLLFCPVTDQQGRLLGAVLAQWDTGTRLPEAEAMDQLIARMKKAGLQIAAVLGLRGTSEGDGESPSPTPPIIDGWTMP